MAIRHAATHEDLPTYEALRAGVEQAIEWIRLEVMVPLVFPSAPNTDNGLLANDEKEQEEYLALIKRYKSLLRAFYRERTSANAALWSGARELRMTLRALEDKLESLPGREGQGVGDSEGKRQEQARWLARTVLFAERGGLVPNARYVPVFPIYRHGVVLIVLRIFLFERKRPQWNPSAGFPTPGEAELRIWTPLLALIADKFAAAAESNGDGERYNDHDDDNETQDGTGWPMWCLSEGLRTVLSYIETRDVRLQRSDPFRSLLSAGQKRKQPTRGQVVPFAHDADYMGLPDDEEDVEEQEETNAVENMGAGEEDVEGEEKEKEAFMACLVGWLAVLLSGFSTSANSNKVTTTTTTGKRRRTGQLSDSLPLEVFGGSHAAATWSVGARGRRSVVRELLKTLDVNVVRGAWEEFVQEAEQGDASEREEGESERNLIR